MAKQPPKVVKEMGKKKKMPQTVVNGKTVNDWKVGGSKASSNNQAKAQWAKRMGKMC